MTRCHYCGASWTGARLEHCMAPACHKTFTSTSAGDKHRTGEHHIYSGPDRRRCMDTWEMEDAGMVQNRLGHWMANAATPENGAPGRPRNASQGEAGGLVQPESENPSVQYGSEVE